MNCNEVNEANESNDVKEMYPVVLRCIKLDVMNLKR